MTNSNLQQAIKLGSLEAVVTALNDGAAIEETDVYGYSGLPLRMACFLGQDAIVEELLKRGADIHVGNSEGSEAPMRLAARGKHQDTVRLLLEYGAHALPGMELGLSPEEIATAQLVAAIRRRGEAMVIEAAGN